MTKKQNSHAKTENVFQYYGNVTLTMIVGTTVTNLRIFAVITTVLSDGVVVLDMLTTDAFLSGYSVMEKMIAEMAQMNLQKIVRHAKKREISSVKIEDVFQSKFTQ